jgi:hypothetical protein
MNFLKQCYLELDNLVYSTENIAELFSIKNKIIDFLKAKNPNRKTNSALHFVLLTHEREFARFKDHQLKDMHKDNFDEARSALMSDLTMYCREFWDPGKDSPWDK